MQKLQRLALFLLNLFSKPLAAFLSVLASCKAFIAERIFYAKNPRILGSTIARDDFPTKEEKKSELIRFENFDDAKALKAFEGFGRKDPFPNIAPALLNSADISDYVAATGMLCPFLPKKLKSASYEIAFQGKCVYWDEEGNKRVLLIEPGQEFLLKRNSIAFVTLEPVFRIPDYIALRFNLKITHIYRGILLGTGPLVDPGFIGKLSVPLHNLTNNDYTLIGGDDLIWMEFTKISTHARWASQEKLANQEGLYHPFPPEKNLPDVEFYLRKADPHRPIRSSIPEVSRKAIEGAQEAKSAVVFFTGLSIFAVLTIGVALINYFSTNSSYLRDAQQKVSAVSYQQEEERRRYEKLQSDLNNLNSQLQDLKAKVDPNNHRK
jgi:deoxycytidine triphosphate deaminase